MVSRSTGCLCHECIQIVRLVSSVENLSLVNRVSGRAPLLDGHLDGLQKSSVWSRPHAATLCQDCDHDRCDLCDLVFTQIWFVDACRLWNRGLNIEIVEIVESYW